MDSLSLESPCFPGVRGGSGLITGFAHRVIDHADACWSARTETCVCPPLFITSETSVSWLLMSRLFLIYGRDR